MRQRAIVPMVLALLLFLAACDATGLPKALTPTSPPGQVATPTIPAASQQPTTSLPTVAIPPPVAPTATEEPTVEPTIEAGATAGTNSEANQELQEVEADAAQLRGLEPKRDVPETFLTQQQLHDNLLQELKQDYSQTDAKQDTLELWLLRLVKDRSLDLFQLQVNLDSEQVIGYYDPRKKDLFVLGDQGSLSPLARVTLAHEFVHSLQDEYYDLQKLRPEHSHNSDRDVAVTSLVEGDAVLSQTIYAYQYLTKAEFQQLMDQANSVPRTVLDSAPRYVRDSLLFPYDQGLNFATELYKANGFDKIDAALADPPTSSEQILHPEKYLQVPRDDPQVVALPPLTSTLGTGWTLADADTTGEFDQQVLLEENGISQTEAETAAAGWGGGSYALYMNGGDGLLIQTLSWDTPKDADEYEASLQKSYAGQTKDGDLWSDQGRFSGIKRSGDKVTLVVGTVRKTVESALAAVK
jgi:hypothetical protein